MKKVEINYNPYKMSTKMLIDGIDVCQNDTYENFKEFIDNKIPLQTWIEPIGYLDWPGFVNKVSDPEFNDEIKLIFSGRKIDFEDLKRALSEQNDKRESNTKVRYHFVHKKVLDDKILSQNIDEVVSEIKSNRFKELVESRTTQCLTKKYEDLDNNYKIAKENVFYIVLAGLYSSGKSTLINSLIRHDILPMSSKTCTSKNCRIRHDSSLNNKVSLTCYGQNDEVVIERKVFDNDYECAKQFLNICPVGEDGSKDKYPNIVTMEIGVNLSHLYPNSINDDDFTIVLIDTPGMNSAKSSQNGINKHAQVAFDAISLESKPIIIFCVDANYYDDTSIGKFMKEIVTQVKEEQSGFNDRFLFVMNKSDAIDYKNGETAEDNKSAFAEYLTDHSKWGIDDKDNLNKIAEEASHFVPRVFMTSSLIDFAIQKDALNFTDEEMEDEEKYNLFEKLESFTKKICRFHRSNYYLSNYCDIPNYKKTELKEEFNNAIEKEDKMLAVKIQSGIPCIEIAIKDYIKRYAYPIKVRDLLSTFEDILDDVNSFTAGILAEMKNAKKELGEKKSERKEANGKKEHENEKIAVLEKAKGKIDEQLKSLDNIVFNSKALGRATSDLRADIEENPEIRFIRSHPKVSTGQKNPFEVHEEIDKRVKNIKKVFGISLNKTNKKLEEIKSVHDDQIIQIFNVLKNVVVDLEKTGVLDQGEYKFTNSVMWKMNFANINSNDFAQKLKKKIVDKSSTTVHTKNVKKEEWKNSWNPFKKIGAIFLDDEIVVTKVVDGYYETTEIKKCIDAYLLGLQKESNNMELNFKKVMDNSKKQVCDLTERLLEEVSQFLDDIKIQEHKIKKLSSSIEELNKEIIKDEKICDWLNNLSKKIKEGE